MNTQTSGTRGVVVALLLGLLSAVGCSSKPTPPALEGDYYAFARGFRPTGPAFTEEQAPVARLTIKSDHTWTMEVGVAEEPFHGEWTRQGAVVDLKEDGASMMQLSAADPGRLVPLNPEMRGDDAMNFERMSPKWEKNYKAAKRASLSSRSRDRAAPPRSPQTRPKP